MYFDILATMIDKEQSPLAIRDFPHAVHIVSINVRAGNFLNRCLLFIEYLATIFLLFLGTF